MKRGKEEIKDQKLMIVIERLTFISWSFSVWPYLISRNFKSNKIYYIDTSKPGFFVSSLTMFFSSSRIEKLNFRLVDIHDDQGNMVRERIGYFDLCEIQKDILSRHVFRNILPIKIAKNRIAEFIAKQIISADGYSNNVLWRAQFLIQVVVWKMKKERLDGVERGILFMDRRVWFEEIKKYASICKVELISARNIRFNFKQLMMILLGVRLKALQSKYFYIKREGLFRFIKNLFFYKGNFAKTKKFPKTFLGKTSKFLSPKLAVQYCGQFNLNKPELHSDLFFWQQSKFSSKDILIMFNSFRDPFDEVKSQEIKKYGMGAVSLSPEASTMPEADIFYHWKGGAQLNFSEINMKTFKKTAEEKWLKRQLSYYSAQYNYWFDFFRQYNIKLYLTWFRYSSEHYVIADAIQALGGATVIYQRAFEEFAAVTNRISADINFGFSYANAEIERGSGSCIPYYVVVGYFGDYRFPLIKEKAQEIRNNLQAKGAKHIISFSDENSGEDSRWHTGHEFMQVNYEFLLGKLLSESQLGLVIKPKVPSTLRKRLGHVADLLKQAESTGRCFVVEGGTLHGSYPPAVAALAADLAIHGHLAGATAAVEAALAGVPTLVIDREGWPISTLYNKLGKGKVIFTDWHSLWQAYKENLNVLGSVSGFGDWTSVLKELDPFRDGKAAERIGTYLKWLMDGFKSGLSRDTVMADAAQRYSDLWGRDKVIEINQYTRENIKVAEALKI